MVFGRIYLSRNTLGFPRSLIVYASTVQAEQTVPAQVTLCLLLKHTSPGLCCLGDTTFLLFRPVAGCYDLLLSIPVRQVLSTNKVASSRLFVHRHARLSSQAIQIVSQICKPLLRTPYQSAVATIICYAPRAFTTRFALPGVVSYLQAGHVLRRVRTQLPFQRNYS